MPTRKTAKKTTPRKPKGPTIKKASKAELWFAFPDIHFPDHDPEALELATYAHEVLKPNNTLLLGDVLDCGIFSFHSNRTIPEIEAAKFKENEIDPCNAFLDRLQKNTKEKLIMLEGNHEQRIERWAANNGRIGEEIYKFISPAATLGRNRKNFQLIPYEVPTGSRMGYAQIVKPSAQMKTGGLVAVHGWSHAKHAARRHLELSRSTSILYGHTHRKQEDNSRDPWNGNQIKAFSPGCLSKLQPLYAHGGTPSEWTHGFALIYVGKTSWTSYMIGIDRGSCVLPSGVEISL